MALSPHEFWAEPHAGEGDALPALTPEWVARAEAFFAVTLPTAYLDLLKLRNGGYSKGFVIPVGAAHPWVGGHIEVDHLNGIGFAQPCPPHFDKWEGNLNIYMSRYMAEEWGLPEKQILLCGDGHTWITLDYRHTDEPVVTWLDSDAGPTDVDQVIAPSFAAFLAGLAKREPIAEAG